MNVSGIIAQLGDLGATSHHLRVATLVLSHLLGRRRGAEECNDFADVLGSIPTSSRSTLTHYECVMHTCACFYLHQDFVKATTTYWREFSALPSLRVTLERVNTISFAEDLASPSALDAALRGIMVVLTSNSTRDLIDLKHSMLLLDANLATMDAYPLLVLHDGLGREQAAMIESWRRNGLVVTEHFRLRDLAFESIFLARGGSFYRNADKAHKAGGADSDGNGEGRGYMHMIRMYSSMLFQHPVLHAFTTYVRLDTDSFFIGPTDDLVAQLQAASGALRQASGYAEAHVSYGYWCITNDAPAVTAGLWDVTRAFMAALNLTGASLDHHLDAHGDWNLQVFYNNLEVLRPEWMRSRTCIDFFRFVEWNPEWFARRWSDAVVRSMQVFLSLQYAETIRLRVSYKHQEPTVCEAHGNVIYLIANLSHPEASLCVKHGRRIQALNKRLALDRSKTLPRAGQSIEL